MNNVTINLHEYEESLSTPEVMMHVKGNCTIAQYIHYTHKCMEGKS